MAEASDGRHARPGLTLPHPAPHAPYRHPGPGLRIASSRRKPPTGHPSASSPIVNPAKGLRIASFCAEPKAQSQNPCQTSTWHIMHLADGFCDCSRCAPCAQNDRWFVCPFNVESRVAAVLETRYCALALGNIREISPDSSGRRPEAPFNSRMAGHPVNKACNAHKTHSPIPRTAPARFPTQSHTSSPRPVRPIPPSRPRLSESASSRRKLPYRHPGERPTAVRKDRTRTLEPANPGIRHSARSRRRSRRIHAKQVPGTSCTSQMDSATAVAALLARRMTVGLSARSMSSRVSPRCSRLGTVPWLLAIFGKFPRTAMGEGRRRLSTAAWLVIQSKKRATHTKPIRRYRAPRQPGKDAGSAMRPRALLATPGTTCKMTGTWATLPR